MDDDPVTGVQLLFRAAIAVGWALIYFYWRKDGWRERYLHRKHLRENISKSTYYPVVEP